MKSHILYIRDGQHRTAFIDTRLAPNMLAVKFTVIALELDDGEQLALGSDGHLLEGLLEQLNIQILDVQPDGAHSDI